MIKVIEVYEYDKEPSVFTAKEDGTQNIQLFRRHMEYDGHLYSPDSNPNLYLTSESFDWTEAKGHFSDE